MTRIFEQDTWTVKPVTFGEFDPIKKERESLEDSQDRDTNREFTSDDRDELLEDLRD